jgi:hypothetical protein
MLKQHLAVVVTASVQQAAGSHMPSILSGPLLWLLLFFDQALLSKPDQDSWLKGMAFALLARFNTIGYSLRPAALSEKVSIGDGQT